ncbi:MAG TPA: 50S ribosomal protein L22 [Candidatus Saccharimonadales bacterium]|nr:50S ribosomal protein L22 [Candidatus Saccharimonadales bacterium]
MAEVQAISKGIRMSPRKVGLIASLVRDRTVADALVILQHTPKRAAGPVVKAIASAKANALNNHGLAEQSLVIASLEVTAGATMKRFRPIAHGAAHPIAKRTSHIRVVLTGEPKPKKTPATKAATKKVEKE